MNQGNGSKETNQGTFTTQKLEENPYLRRTLDPNPTETIRSDDEIIADEFGAPVEPEDKTRKIKVRRRRFALVALASLFLFAIVFAIAVYRRSPTRVHYGRAPQPGVLPPVPSPNATTGRDARTQKAIEDAQRLAADQPSTTVATATATPLVDTGVKSTTAGESPFKIPPDSGRSETAPITSDSLGHPQSIPDNSNNQTTASAATSPNVIRSQRSSEISLYTSDFVPPPVTGPPIAKSTPIEKKPVVASLGPTLPAFASMLPVRTVGALYTLRTGALVRFELTRDTKGNGWSMKRGTVLVGTSKGGDVDRAYVSLAGFIDSETGKLVKLSGDLLGGDGAAGLKGKRRQINGGWSRAFARVGSAALDISGALLSRRSRDTVIISDGARTRAINPITDELSGVLSNEVNGKQGQSFVEVVAGTPGYVLVTDLPKSIKGTDATPEITSEALTSLSDVDLRHDSTGLSERELADLLATGSPEDIRAAMPRMSPEMRRVAAAVLRP